MFIDGSPDLASSELEKKKQNRGHRMNHNPLGHNTHRHYKVGMRFWSIGLPIFAVMALGSYYMRFVKTISTHVLVG